MRSASRTPSRSAAAASASLSLARRCALSACRVKVQGVARNPHCSDGATCNLPAVQCLAVFLPCQLAGRHALSAWRAGLLHECVGADTYNLSAYHRRTLLQTRGDVRSAQPASRALHADTHQPDRHPHRVWQPVRMANSPPSGAQPWAPQPAQRQSKDCHL